MVPFRLHICQVHLDSYFKFPSYAMGDIRAIYVSSSGVLDFPSLYLL